MNEEAKNHPDFEFVFSDAQEDSARQMNQVENFITQKVDVIIFMPVDTVAAPDIVAKVNQSEIPIIVVNQTFDGVDQATAFVGSSNRNGHIDDEYSANIHVDEVIARGGGRGLFCVSRSGGAVIERIDLAGTGNNAILIENCHNVTIEGGVVEGPNGICIAARNDMPNTSDVLIENLTVRNSAIFESPCGNNVEFRNITLENSTMNVCSD
jgi:hypothetical protein